MKVEDLKKPATKRVFRAWIEDWEKDLIMQNDCVAEAQLLEKYKGLVFVDPNFGTTYTIHDKKLDWKRRDKKKKIDGGWHVLGVDEDDDNETYVIEQELIDWIVDRAERRGYPLPTALMRSKPSAGL